MTFSINRLMDIELKYSDSSKQAEKNLTAIFNHIRLNKNDSILIESTIESIRIYLNSEKLEDIVYISKNQLNNQLELKFRDFLREITFDINYKFNRNKSIYKIENIIGFSRDDCKRALIFIKNNNALTSTIQFKDKFKSSNTTSIIFNTRVLYRCLWLENTIIVRSWKKILLDFLNNTYDNSTVIYNRPKIFFFYYLLNGEEIPKEVNEFKNVEKYLTYGRASFITIARSLTTLRRKNKKRKRKHLGRQYHKNSEKIPRNKIHKLGGSNYRYANITYSEFVKKMLSKFLPNRHIFLDKSNPYPEMFLDVLCNKIIQTILIKKKGRVFYHMKNRHYQALFPISNSGYYSGYFDRDYILRAYINNLNEILSILYYDQLLPKYKTPISQAYTKTRSIKTCAILHKDSRFIVKTDIKSFFESISKEMISHTLTKYLGELKAKQIAEFCVYDDKLRLGSKFSPIISNIVAFELDMDIQNILLKKNNYSKFNLIFTRYSDDLHFSSNSKEQFPFEEFISDLRNIVKKHKFKLNKKKTMILTDKYKKAVLSVVLNQDNFSVSKTYRKNLRSQIFQMIGLDFVNYYVQKNKNKEFAPYEWTWHFEHMSETEKDKINGKIKYIFGINQKQAISINNYKENVIKNKHPNIKQRFGELYLSIIQIPKEIIIIFLKAMKNNVDIQTFKQQYMKVFTENIDSELIIIKRTNVRRKHIENITIENLKVRDLKIQALDLENLYYLHKMGIFQERTQRVFCHKRINILNKALNNTKNEFLIILNNRFKMRKTSKKISKEPITIENKVNDLMGIMKKNQFKKVD